MATIMVFIASMKIHFISGLPRSGSTLLAAILRQNCNFHASMSGPLAEIFMGLLRSMSGANELASFLSLGKRQRILESVVHAYYSEFPDGTTIFDTNRFWCGMLPAISLLFPSSRVVCCVRSPAWIIDSIERKVQQNAFQPSRIFNYDAAGNVYTRAEAMVKSNLLGGALNALRQAWFSEHGSRLVAIRYDSLTKQPGEVMSRLYGLLGEKPFAHDFDHLDYDEPQIDAEIGMPGFHKVSSRVEWKARTTILPPDLFNRHNHSFWDDPEQNPRHVPIL